MSDIVIKAEQLSKMYRLGVINNGTLFQDIQTWIALKRGKEDPNSRIGENKYAGDKDHFWALKDVNFEIKQGDRVGIIGKNGAGKSTLLKVLSRITAPTEGLVQIKGKVSSLLEVGTGFHGELTGRENIYLNGAILGMKKREIDKKMDEIIAFSEIENHIDTPVKRYSSGMYVRLAFAVAAHLDSDILIADEVLAVGDASFQKKAIGKMGDLSTGQGRTVLFVSHNMAAVKSLCNKGILLENGEISFVGDTRDALNKYTQTNLNSNEYVMPRLDADKNGKKIFFTDVKCFLNKQVLQVIVKYNANEDCGAVVALKVSNQDQIDIFTILDTDINPSCFSKKKGKHGIIFNIPVEFLIEGVYSVTCSLSDMKSERFDFLDDLISFEITTPPEYIKNHFQGRKGIFIPAFDVENT